MNDSIDYKYYRKRTTARLVPNRPCAAERLVKAMIESLFEINPIFADIPFVSTTENSLIFKRIDFGR